MFVDYTGGFEDGEGVLGDEEKSANRLSLNRYFFDDRWTKNRVVTSMDWSVAYPELMCASYDKNPGLATNSVFPRLVVEKKIIELSGGQINYPSQGRIMISFVPPGNSHVSVSDY